jgi:hypothetical protein
VSSYSRFVVCRLQVVQQVKSEPLEQTSKAISEKLVQKQHKHIDQSEQQQQQQQDDHKSATKSCDRHKLGVEGEYAQRSQSEQTKQYSNASFVVELER